MMANIQELRRPEQAPQQQLLKMLDADRFKKGMAAVAGKYMTPDRMMRLCVSAIRTTPKLLQADPPTVLGSLMTAAALELEPNTVTQECFLIPYDRSIKQGDNWIKVTECQFQIGYKGFMKLGYRSPRVKKITPRAVRQHDDFDYLEGTGGFLRYKKALNNAGEVIGAFSYLELQDGTEDFMILGLDEIHRARDRSQTWKSLKANIERSRNDKERDRNQKKFDDTPWQAFFDDMSAKSAIRKHAKFMPLESPQLAVAADIDGRAEVGKIDLSELANPDLARSIINGEYSIGDSEPEQEPAEDEPPAPAAAPPPETVTTVPEWHKNLTSLLHTAQYRNDLMRGGKLAKQISALKKPLDDDAKAAADKMIIDRRNQLEAAPQEAPPAPEEKPAFSMESGTPIDEGDVPAIQAVMQRIAELCQDPSDANLAEAKRLAERLPQGDYHATAWDEINQAIKW